MKTKLLLLLLTTNFLFCQVTDVLTDFNSAGLSNLTFKSNYIYFNSYVQKKVYRIDHTFTNPTVELVYQFNENPNFVYIENDILFVGVENPFKTYKIDLNTDELNTELIANVAGPMVKINDDLYIGQYSASKIVKINLTTSLQTDVLVGYKPNFFTVHDNKLFFTSNYTNALYKYDPSSGILDTILNNLNYASGIVMNEALFFICESSVSSISIYSNPGFQFENLFQLPANSWPNGAILVGNDLFFVQTIAGKISKMPINTFLGNSDFLAHDPKIKIYPNPSTEVINIDSKYFFEKYSIYNNEGKLIQNSTITNNKINVSELPKGQYVLMLDKHSNTFLKN
ncbi:T9SS type A sorting domain-containing protein [Flavobacterium jejuense]|uniref:T9SS type A sorting domain-containing protein n=1 Tax=Flavobacterium jejuense TaxID=1544455 RepID=A0ABX0ITK7_9FLAO|nr:T9SS type A sorting domain-containing protein [Flavobacterium jejuense]NHN25858.1 T9SS type A sorting domain-containing protein [Flavobacterium jejuense]